MRVREGVARTELGMILSSALLDPFGDIEDCFLAPPSHPSSWPAHMEPGIPEGPDVRTFPARPLLSAAAELLESL